MRSSRKRVEPEVIGWTVDQVPCSSCREVQYGVRIFVRSPDETITSVWFCGETPAVTDLMRRSLAPGSS